MVEEQQLAPKHFPQLGLQLRALSQSAVQGGVAPATPLGSGVSRKRKQRVASRDSKCLVLYFGRATSSSGTRTGRWRLPQRRPIRFFPLLGKGLVYIEVVRARRSGKTVDLSNWIGSPIRFSPNLSCIFVVYFIRAHVRGASLGARLSGDMDRS